MRRVDTESYIGGQNAARNGREPPRHDGVDLRHGHGVDERLHYERGFGLPYEYICTGG